MIQKTNLTVAQNGDLQLRRGFEPSFNSMQGELDLRKYWQVIRKHLWSIIGLSLSVGLLVYLILLAMPPIYKATATLVIEPKSMRKIISIQDENDRADSGAEYFNTQIEILKSRTLARRVVDNLPPSLQQELGEQQSAENPKPESDRQNTFLPEWITDLFKSPKPVAEEPREPVDPQMRRVGRLLGQLSITPVRNTYLIKIEIESANPKLAMAAANQFGIEYIGSQVDRSSQTTKENSRWLADRVEKLHLELIASEKRLTDYMESQGLISISQGKDQSDPSSGVMSLTANELSDSQAKLMDVRRQRVELETVYNQIYHSQGGISANLLNIPLIANNPSLVALKSQENDAATKLQLTAGRYGIRHPERQAAEAALTAVRDALQRELGEVVKVLGNQLQAIRSNEAALEKLVAQSKSKVQEINRKDSKLSSMRQEVETNRNLYELFFNRLKETTETSGLMPLNAHILDAATLPEAPYKPKKARGAVIAALLSMLGGIGLAFLMYQLDTSLKSADEVEEKLGLPLLGMVPYNKPQKNKDNLEPVYDEDSQGAFSEAIRTVRTGVVFGTLNSPNPILGISSAVEDEGKSTLVLNLGFAMAQLRRVLIIETDLRKPALANRLQFPTRQPGLCNYLLQEVSLDKCIHHLEPNLDLITAGKIPPNPLEILSSSQFRQLLESLHEKYEMIILDTPPLGPVSDSLVLSQLVDAMILVARAQKTPIKLIRNAISGLERVGAPVIGVILNASSSYSGKYYHHYQSPYGEYRSDETAT